MLVGVAFAHSCGDCSVAFEGQHDASLCLCPACLTTLKCCHVLPLLALIRSWAVMLRSTLQTCCMDSWCWGSSCRHRYSSSGGSSSSTRWTARHQPPHSHQLPAAIGGMTVSTCPQAGRALCC